MVDPKGLPGFHTFSMALYHKWNVKNDFAYLLTFFSLISEGLGGVCWLLSISSKECISIGALGARTHRSLIHHLLHLQILRLIVLIAHAILKPRALFC